MVLTERDRDLLLLVGLCQYVSTDQVAREFFPTQDRARRRVRQLFDQGLVKVTLRSSTMPNLLSLTKEGMAEVRQGHPDLGDRLQPCPPIRLAGVAHHLGLVDTRLFAVHQIRKLGGILLAWESGIGRLARGLGLGTVRLQPDALFEVAVGQDVFLHAVEFDCGTEAIPILAAKLDRYAELILTTDQLVELWIVVDGGRQRQAAIETHIYMRRELAKQTRVLSHDLVLARPLLTLPPVLSQAGHGPTGPNTQTHAMQIGT